MTLEEIIREALADVPFARGAWRDEAETQVIAAALRIAREAREAALEEAAKVAEKDADLFRHAHHVDGGGPEDCHRGIARRIRALKDAKLDGKEGK